MEQKKDWKKIIMYFIPVIALILGNILQIDHVQIEAILTTVGSAVISLVAGVLALIGIIKSHDKNKQA
jgi:hypothetical protein